MTTHIGRKYPTDSRPVCGKGEPGDLVISRACYIARPDGVCDECTKVHVCAICGEPLSMKPDAVSRRKHAKPTSYRCAPCHRKKARAFMGST